MTKERIIFHIDVNNAFLSWSAVKLLEQGYDIDIRKVPAVIGGDESKRHGIVLAKSPEAKKYNIKTAETLYSARKKCKNLLIFPPDYKFYKEKSNQFFSYLMKYTPDIEIFSIDECFMDMSNTSYLYNDYINLAYKIKNDIYNMYGFTVNVGIGNNKLCAKMASDLEKPNKVHTMYNNEIVSKMWPLPIEELFMVGRQTSKKLQELGVNTIGDLANFDLNILKKYFKSQAVIIYNHANGIDDTKVINSYDTNKCISVSETFEHDIDNDREIEKILLLQTQKVSRLLRKKKRYANTIAITFKNYDFKCYSRQIKLKNSTNSTTEIYNNVINLFKETWDGTKLRNIGVRLANFSKSMNVQTNIFDIKEKEDKPIDIILDKIVEKYGDNSITLASLTKKEK